MGITEHAAFVRWRPDRLPNESNAEYELRVTYGLIESAVYNARELTYPHVLASDKPENIVVGVDDCIKRTKQLLSTLCSVRDSL